MARKVEILSRRAEYGAVWEDSFHPQATQERIPEPEAQHAIPVDGVRQSQPRNTKHQQRTGRDVCGHHVKAQGTQWNQEGQQEQVP